MQYTLFFLSIQKFLFANLRGFVRLKTREVRESEKLQKQSFFMEDAIGLNPIRLIKLINFLLVRA